MKPFHGLSPYLSRGKNGSTSITVVLLFVAALSSLIPAFLHRVYFDRVIPDRSTEMIIPVLILILCSETVGILSRFQAERLLSSESRGKRHRQRMGLIRRLWSLETRWFDNPGPGAPLRHFDDAGLLGDMSSVLVRDVTGPLLVLLLLLPAMLLIQPILSLVRIAVLIPGIVAGIGFLEQDLAIERKIWAVRRSLTTGLVQGARGISTLKSGGGTIAYSRYLRSTMNELGCLEKKRRIHGAGWEAVAGGISRTGAALSVVLAVYFVIRGRLTFGSYIAFSILSTRCLASVGELLGGLRTLARTGNAAARHSELSAERTDESPPAVSLARYTPEAGGLNITGLSFSYRRSGLLFRGLDLTVEVGERVLLTGGSGTGKSTLLSLILGFNTPSKGIIEFSGITLNSCRSSTRRALIGAVLQNPSFFDGTVRENLCLYGAPPSDRYLWKALESAAADDIVSRIPGGLDARLHGADSGLSGGQRQRLAIARLMVRTPPLILLDEPVNALDSACQEQVHRSLERAFRDRTVLLISHGGRLPLTVDRRLLLAGGNIEAADRNGIHG